MTVRFPLTTAALLLTVTVARADITYDFSVANGGWTSVNVFGSNNTTWQYSNTPAAPGGGNAWFTPGQANGANGGGSIALTSPSGPLVVYQAGTVSGSFTHRFNFENNFDGGQLQFRVSPAGGGGFGPWNTVPRDRITNVTYSASPLSGFDPSPLTGQHAFTGTSAGYGTPAYVTSNFTLGTGVSPFATGTNYTFAPDDLIEIRFLAAWGAFVQNGSPNWQIGSVTLLNVAPEPGSLLAVAGLALGGVGAWRRRRAQKATG
jgi:hypothetical protein